MSTDVVKKQTMYLIVVFALLVGFLGGVFYSVYRSPGLAPHKMTSEQTENQRMAQKKQALASLEGAARENPDDASVWVELGHAYFDLSRPKEAITAYTKALELQPGDTEVMTDLGVMYHENHEHDRAVALFNEVLKARPDHAQARFNKGVVLLIGLKKPEEALAEWRTLLQYHPDAISSSGKSVRDLIQQVERQLAAQNAR